MGSTLLQLFAPLCLVFLLQYFTTTNVAGDSPSPYIPVDNILINCGSLGNSEYHNRNWIGDVNSHYLARELMENHSSLSVDVGKRPSSTALAPFSTARLSLSPFRYIFPVTAGQKFIRLYFYPASYSNEFDRSNALFSVKAGRFTLLNNFNASLNAEPDSSDGINLNVSSEGIVYREYCINMEEDQTLNITFSPSPGNDSTPYAFINGIEIMSMPTNLYYTRADDPGVQFIGQQSPYPINNSTALETVYRLNVGGQTISPAEDTGMFRTWTQDDNYFLREYDTLFLPSNGTIKLNFTKVPNYTAPEDVYRTARTMGRNTTINLNHNLTWKFLVDSGFNYLIRLHFCEIEPGVISYADRQFLIFIDNQTAEKAADVIGWSGGNGHPVKRDYTVSMLGKGTDKKRFLYIILGALPQRWRTSYQNAILNGVEIFKVSDNNDNLAGPNPDPLPPNPPTIGRPGKSRNSKGNRTTIIGVAFGGVAGFIVLSILGLLILRRSKRAKGDSGPSDGTSCWGPFSFTTTKSTKTLKSSLPAALSRCFSLAEIKAATSNFDDIFIIGVGGFGKVYKGYIDGGVHGHPVAIKRLAPGSQQGIHEFETEIKLLSQLRHMHLVSLIGYCNDGTEMILVYDYMARGTLRDHLYNSNNPPLSWKQRLQICIGAARGLSYLHTGAKHTIIHRDVKTTNILLDDEWVAKVSDFGLSKMGPTGVSKAHVSTVVKGSFGYLDPEYYRRQQLTEKSDVYSFGVVLCEVLSARPPILRTVETKQVSLAEWARESSRSGKYDEIVDPALMGQIVPESLNKFGEIAVSCLHDSGAERPSMNDVVWGLEFALQMQESTEIEVGKHDHVADVGMIKDAEMALLPQCKSDDSNNMFSSSGGQVSSIYSNSEVTMTGSGEQSFSSTSKGSDRQVSSRAVFSEIFNPQAR